MKDVRTSPYVAVVTITSVVLLALNLLNVFIGKALGNTVATQVAYVERPVAQEVYEAPLATTPSLIPEKPKVVKAKAPTSKVKRRPIQVSKTSRHNDTQTVTGNVYTLDVKITRIQFINPVVGYSEITSPFGDRIHPINHKEKFHLGVDIDAPYNATVVSVDDGVVVTAGWESGYGRTVEVDHGGVKTRYAHLSDISVVVGQSVKQGEQVGLVGSTGYSTGSHLHFEVETNGVHRNPVKYLPK